MIIETVVFSVGPLLSLLVAKCGLKTWIKFEAFSTIFAGAASFIFYPESFLNLIMINGPIDKYHRFMCAWDGLYLILSVLYPIMLINSKDEAVFYGHFWSRIIDNTLIIADNLVSYSEGKHFNYKLLCLFTSFAIFQLLINIYFLIVTKKPSGQNPFRDCANSICKLEFYLLLTIGLVMYSFPDRVSSILGAPKGPNESYRCLTRVTAALIVSVSIESFCMSEFIFLKDKKNYMLSRVLGGLSRLALFIAGHYYFHLYSIQVMTVLLVANTVYNLLMFYGYFITPGEPLHQKSN